MLSNQVNLLTIIRSILFYIVMSTSCVLFAIVLFGIVDPIQKLFKKEPQPHGHLLIPIAWAKLILFALKFLCGIHYKVECYDEFIKVKDKPLIIVLNHQSFLDTFLAFALFFPVTTVSKKEILKIPILGPGYYRVTNAILIDRKATTSAFKKIIVEGTKRIKSGYNFVIYPEGTRQHQQKIGHYASGAFKLAVETKSYILPVAHNSGICWPVTPIWKIPGTVTVKIGEAVHAAEKDVSQLREDFEKWAIDNLPTDVK